MLRSCDVGSLSGATWPMQAAFLDNYAQADKGRGKIWPRFRFVWKKMYNSGQDKTEEIPLKTQTKTKKSKSKTTHSPPKKNKIRVKSIFSTMNTWNLDCSYIYVYTWSSKHCVIYFLSTCTRPNLIHLCWAGSAEPEKRLLCCIYKYMSHTGKWNTKYCQEKNTISIKNGARMNTAPPPHPNKKTESKIQLCTEQNNFTCMPKSLVHWLLSKFLSKYAMFSFFLVFFFFFGLLLFFFFFFFFLFLFFFFFFFGLNKKIGKDLFKNNIKWK